MKKSYVLGQYLNRIRKSLQNAGYQSNEIRNFLLQTLFSVFCENCGLFLGKPFSAIVLNSSAVELGKKLADFFETLPSDISWHCQFDLDSELQNSLVSFVLEDWSDVSPAEFGEIFLSDGLRKAGTVYTDSSDIDRILDGLVFGSPSDSDMRTARFLDPASGCGNFLIRTAQRLSELELNCGIIHGRSWVGENRFVGIEIDPDAAEVSRAAMFIQLRKCNIRFAEQFGRLNAVSLELPKNIICADALTLDWTDLKPDYIIGNPPFISSPDADQRRTLIRAAETADRIDYAGAWIVKAARCIQQQPFTSCGYIITSSVCQGSQVKPIWQKISGIIDIDFAYAPFKLDSEQIQVWCAIFGFSSKECAKSEKRLYLKPDSTPLICKHINAYLHDDEDMFLLPSSKQRFGYPAIKQGRYEPQTIFSSQTLKNRTAQCGTIPISRYITADSMLKSESLFCLEEHEQPTNSYIVIPRHSSETRKYIPIGFFEKQSLRCNSSVEFIVNADIVLFGVLCSSMHMAFMRYFSGRLEMRYRYSGTLIYNNLFIPELSKEHRSMISGYGNEILTLRKKYSSMMTLGEMYKNMPDDLENVHRKLDCVVDKVYNQGKMFLSDAHRVRFLYDMI